MSDRPYLPHGHITPARMVARCGGPAICRQCAEKLAAYWVEVDATRARLVAEATGA